MLTIMAFHNNRLASYDMETGWHGLIARDAFGIVAHHEVCQLLRTRNAAFVDNLIFANFIYDSRWSDDG